MSATSVSSASLLSLRLLDPARTLTRTNADDLPFALSEKGVRTWGNFAVAVNNWREAFSNAGIDSVALYFTDLFDLSSALFGAWTAGVRAILPADATQATCARLTQLTGAFAGEFEPEHIAGVRILSAADTKTPCREQIDASRELIALFTSGSTGEPTLITKRLSQLFCEVPAIEVRRPEAHLQELPQNTVILTTVPAQHIYGLLFAILWPAAAVRPFWHTRILYPEELLARTRKAKVRFGSALWVTSPAQLKRLPLDLAWNEVSDAIKVIYTSGGPLSDEGLSRTIAATGHPPMEIFGSSESGGIAWRSRSFDAAGRITGEAFHPFASIQVRIENGLLTIKSPQLASNDWETTADRAQLHEDGTFTLLGRADRIVKIEEKRVSLTAIERALVDSGLVLECRVFVESASGKLAVAAVPTIEAVARIRHEGKAALVKSLRALLSESLERVCLPRRWRFVPELPENMLGKRTTADLEALFDPRAPQAVVESKVENKDETSAVLIVSIAATTPFFEGHFPEFQLLPGLVQINWACDLARQLFHITAPFAGVKNLKFMQPIRPGSTLVLKLSQSARGVAFAFENTDPEADPHSRTFAKGTLLFRAAPVG